MKPFCSGGLSDVRILQALQPGELSDAEMIRFISKNPLPRASPPEKIAAK